MRNSQPDIDKLSALCGVNFTKMAPAGSGLGVKIYHLETAEKERFFVKHNISGTARPELEGWMLRQLENAGMPIPQILYCDEDYLILEFVEGSTSLSGEAQIHAARLMAELHKTTGSRYGLEKDTVIGALEQPNQQTENWADFFRQWRLVYSAERAYEEGQLDLGTFERIEKRAGNLEDFLTGEEKPCLVHGDMWGGNLIAQGGKVKAFIDPAIYYASHETELAFAGLFGCFGQGFYYAYNEILPIAPGFFETRMHLYNLYPLLVHVRLFGRAYLPKTEASLRMLGY
jgi:fructosamine-3-kinase